MWRNFPKGIIQYHQIGFMATFIRLNQPHLERIKRVVIRRCHPVVVCWVVREN